MCSSDRSLTVFNGTGTVPVTLFYVFISEINVEIQLFPLILYDTVTPAIRSMSFKNNNSLNNSIVVDIYDFFILKLKQ